MILPSREEVRSGQRSKVFVLATTSVQLQIKWGEVEFFNTDCRALLVKLGLGEESTSVREKSVYSKYISIYIVKGWTQCFKGE